MPEFRTVLVPAMDAHEGIHATRVRLLWRCRFCGGPRGEVRPAISFDGSRRLPVDGWTNPCGHVDKYGAVRKEAASAASMDLDAGEDEANATLIAAAPDLLEALVMIVIHTENGGVLKVANGGVEDTSVYRKAKAAIAKAQGMPSMDGGR